MRQVAIVGFAQRQHARFDGSPNGVEMLVPIFGECFARSGFTKSDIDFWCSGSSDYLAGRSFSFVSAVDAIGAIPAVRESHVEMDAAWALYEAWVKIQTGEIDTALVYGFGKSSAGVLRRTLALQLDPYTMTPLWPDTVSLAGLQARLGLESQQWSEHDMASVVARNLSAATSNQHAIRHLEMTADDVLNEPIYCDPLRKLDCAPVTDGAAAIVLSARTQPSDSPTAFITGITHAIDAHHLGARDLLRAPSVPQAAAQLDLTNLDVAELHAPFSHQELMVVRELNLDGSTTINPSGGTLSGNPMFAGGLIRIGEAATSIQRGYAQKALAHATSGPLLQQNLLCVMEAR
jgi:acetyl-CoA acetyltransferase